MIRDHLSSTGQVTDEVVQEVWQNLYGRYETSNNIAEQLLDKLEKFSIIRGANLGIQFQQLHDLCKIINFNIPKCPELQIMNIEIETKYARVKLPDYLQLEWRKWVQNYESSN